jgi:hypothetical protein
MYEPKSQMALEDGARKVVGLTSAVVDGITDASTLLGIVGRLMMFDEEYYGAFRKILDDSQQTNHNGPNIIAIRNLLHLFDRYMEDIRSEYDANEEWEADYRSKF